MLTALQVQVCYQRSSVPFYLLQNQPPVVTKNSCLDNVFIRNAKQEQPVQHDTL